jgi:siroheme decarboxylase
LTTPDANLIRALQGGLPPVMQPYADVARRLGTSAEDVVARLAAMKADGRLRRMAAVVNQRRVGIEGNILAAWNVPEDRLDEVGEQLATKPQVSHAYVRTPGPEWPYRLYTMVHAADESACRAFVEAWGRELGVDDVRVLPTVREWKKSAPLYYAGDHEA